MPLNIADMDYPPFSPCPFFRPLRFSLLLLDISGIIFSLVTISMTYNWSITPLILFTVSAAWNIYILRKHKAFPSPPVQLPDHSSTPRSAYTLDLRTGLPAGLFPATLRAPGSRSLRHLLVAFDEGVMGGLFLAGHLIKMIPEWHYYSGVGKLGMYIAFIMLGATVVHWILTGLHLKGWWEERKKERKDRKEREGARLCRVCERVVEGGKYRDDVVVGTGEGQEGGKKGGVEVGEHAVVGGEA